MRKKSVISKISDPILIYISLKILLTALLKNEITVCFLLLSLPVHAGLLKRIYYYSETCVSVWPTFFLLNVINAQKLAFIFLFGVVVFLGFFQNG